MNRGILKKSLPLKAVHPDIPETAEPFSDNSQSEEPVQSLDDANKNGDGANSAVPPPSSAPCENKKSKGPRKLKNQNLRAVDSIRVASDRFEHSPRSRFLKRRKQTDSTSPRTVDRASFPFPTTGGASLSRQVPSSDTQARHSSASIVGVQNDTDYLCDRGSTDDNKQIHVPVQDSVTDPNVENTNTPSFSSDTSGGNHPTVLSDPSVPSKTESSDDLCVVTQVEKSDTSVCFEAKTPDDSHVLAQAVSPDSNVSPVLESSDTLGNHVSREIVDGSGSPAHKETPDSPSSLIFPEKIEEAESVDPYETSKCDISQDDDHPETTDISEVGAPYEATADDNLITDDIFTLLKDDEVSRSAPMSCDSQYVILDSAVTEASDTDVLSESTKLQPSPDQVLNQSLLVNDSEKMCTSEESADTLSDVTPVPDLSNVNMETVENEAETSATAEAITRNHRISAVEYLMEYDEEETLV